MRLQRWRRAWKTRLLRLFGGTDRKRWLDESSLRVAWDDRTELIASLVPDNSVVLEFGAGRLALGRALPPGCTYIPSDIVSRRADCLIIDLNSRRLPRLPTHDVAVFSGVLEYVGDIGAVARQLAQTTGRIIASYAVLDRAGGEAIQARRERGWVNDWNRDDFVALFADAGFQLENQLVWNGGRNTPPQPVFVFARTNAVVPVGSPVR